jgi:transcriptional regulator with XRE-family HTH domain
MVMDNKLVGQNIRKYRRFRDMSQKELAKEVGYATKSSINKIEAGESSVPIPRLTQIANALRVPLQALMENIPDDGMPYEDYIAADVAKTTQVNELNFVVDTMVEYDELTEYIKQSEQMLHQYQKMIADMQRLRKRFKNDAPKLQEDKDLVYKYHQILPEHQKMVMAMLNGFYQLDSQAQQNAPSDVGESVPGTQKGTPSLQQCLDVQK